MEGGTHRTNVKGRTYGEEICFSLSTTLYLAFSTFVLFPSTVSLQPYVLSLVIANTYRDMYIYVCVYLPVCLGITHADDVIVMRL